MTNASLILETHNLEGGDGDVAAGLVRVLARLAAQTRPLTSLADVVITHRGLAAAARASCDRLAGVPVRWLELPDTATYYEAKNRGFDVATGDIVVFADADCWPDLDWLDALLAPFHDPSVEVVAGRTTYRRDLLGTAASTIDFMYFPSNAGAGHTRNFYANNVAFRREVFAAHRFGEHQMYRGHCVVLGFELHAAGIPVMFVPAARTIHRFPDSARQLLRLRLLRGRDTFEVSPQLVRSVLQDEPRVPRRLKVPRVPRLGPILPLAVLTGRFGFSVRALNHQDMPETRGIRRLATIGAITALTAIDALGAVAGGLRLLRGAPTKTLSYHGDGDRLVA